MPVLGEIKEIWPSLVPSGDWFQEQKNKKLTTHEQSHYIHHTPLNISVYTHTDIYIYMSPSGVEKGLNHGTLSLYWAL